MRGLRQAQLVPPACGGEAAEAHSPTSYTHRQGVRARAPLAPGPGFRRSGAAFVDHGKGSAIWAGLTVCGACSRVRLLHPQ